MVEMNTTFEYNILTEHNLLFPLQCGVIMSDIPSTSVPSHCSLYSYPCIMELYFQFRRGPYNYQSNQWQIK
jgi:hypothetical protein